MPERSTRGDPATPPGVVQYGQVVGRLFSSFTEAWGYFLGRAEPLEWFFGDFPEDEDFVAEGWLIEPPWGIKQAARQLQEAFTEVEWVAAIPDHFLHVWLGGPISLGGRPATLRGSGAFELTYPARRSPSEELLLGLAV